MAEKFAIFENKADISGLNNNEMQMLQKLVDAAKPLNKVFADQVYHYSSELLDFLDSVDETSFPEHLHDVFAKYKTQVKLHFGPHDSTNHKKFLPEFSQQEFVDALGRSPGDTLLKVIFDSDFEPERLPGANLYRFEYPATDEAVEWVKQGIKQESQTDDLEKLVARKFTDPYSIAVIEQDAKGKLQLKNIPYHEAYAKELALASSNLLEAAKITNDETFALYLRESARGLMTGEYRARDLLLLDLDNKLCLTLGPIETYIDEIGGIKAAFEAIVSIRHEEGTKRLRTFQELTPGLINALPCDKAYKNLNPPEKAPLDLADIVYLSGEAAQGTKAIAHALPNDELVTNARGYRKTIFMNFIEAKAQIILMPIAEQVLGKDELNKHGKKNLCDAFLWHVISHEASHPLGRTKDGLDSSVRGYLRDLYSCIEECKADTLGLYNLEILKEKGLIDEELLDAAYTSYTAGIFRSIRLGTQSAHAKANLMFLNYQLENQGISINGQRLYVPDKAKFKQAVTSLAKELLTIEGEGDYQRAKSFSGKYGGMALETQKTLDRIEAAEIPTDIHPIFSF